METTTSTAIQQAYSLIKSGQPREARALLVPIVQQNPDNADAWYLLGFAVTDPAKRVYAFQQVLRINPSHEAAQKQLARLQPPAPAPQSYPWSQPETAAAAPAPRPVRTPAAATAQPAAQKRRFPWELTIALGLAIGLFGGIALYFGRGIDLNRQAAVLYSKRDCAGLAQFDNVSNSYPMSVFGGMFNVYWQVQECRSYLGADKAFKDQNWQSAYELAQDYLTRFPAGIFAEELRQNRLDSLLAWAKNLAVAKDYAMAIQKLKLIESTDPTAALVPTAVDIEFDDYIAWAKELGEQKDYQKAEANLNVVHLSSKASADRQEQSGQELAALYLKWGMEEVASADFEAGLKHLAAARDLGPNLADYDRLTEQANLRSAMALAGKDDFDQALARAKRVEDTATSADSKSEAQSTTAQIMDAYAHSSSEQAKAQMATAAEGVCSKQKPEMALFGLDPATIGFTLVSPFGLKLPDGWQAKTPAALHYVVCNTEKQITIDTCGYQHGHVVRRKRYDWLVVVYDIDTARRVRFTQLPGGAPRHCQYTEMFDVGTTYKDVFGLRPTIDQIVAWLNAQGLNK